MPKQINANLTSWASELDDNALEQALRTSRLPILAGPVCLMADAHFGLGATVGSVVATKNALLPSAVGVDIGCGMVAAETNLTAAELPDDLSALHGFLRDRIPAGVSGHYPALDYYEPSDSSKGVGLPFPKGYSVAYPIPTDPSTGPHLDHRPPVSQVRRRM